MQVSFGMLMALQRWSDDDCFQMQNYYDDDDFVD